MAQVLRGSARTTVAMRAAIQRGQESLQTLATRPGIKPKTVAKWRKRTTTADAPMGPMPASTVLADEQEPMAWLFGRTRCGRSTAACTRCKPRFRTGRARPCTAVFSGTASADCRWGKTDQARPRKNSRITPSATYPSILPGSGPKKAASTHLWPSTAPVRWPSPNGTHGPSGWWPLGFCAASPASCPTKGTPY